MSECDSIDYTPEHAGIAEFVNNKVSECRKFNVDVTADMIDSYIKSLAGNCSPGYDGVSMEHLKFANIPILRRHLSFLFTGILSHYVVPTVIWHRCYCACFEKA